jgi:hypothetical protein
MFVESAVARVPVPALLPSGMFVREGNALPVGALMVSSFTLKPKRRDRCHRIAAGLGAQHRDQPAHIDRRGHRPDDRRQLLGNAAASSAQPAGLVNGLTALTATAGGGSMRCSATLRL